MPRSGSRLATHHPPLSEAARPSAGGAGEDAPALAEALGRLLVFASVYSSDHVRVTSLARPLAEAIARRATDETPCVISLTESGLLVDEEEVAATTVAKRHLRSDLASLSLCQVDFFRTITAPDLIEFATMLRVTTRRGTGRRTFEEPCLPGLPPSIAARFNDFGTPEFGTEEEGATWVGETLEPQTSTEPEMRAQIAASEDWQRLTRLLVTDLLAVIDSGEPGLPSSGLPGVVQGEGEPSSGPVASAPAGGASALSAGGAGQPDTGVGEPAGRADVGRGAGEPQALSSGDPARVPGGATSVGAKEAKSGSETREAETAGGARGAGGGAGGGAATAGPGGKRSAAGRRVSPSASSLALGARGVSAGQEPPSAEEGPLVPRWLGALAGAASAAGVTTGGQTPGPGGTSPVPGAGRGGTLKGRNVGRRKAGAPGIAPEGGYRARGSRERVRAIEEAVRRAVERAIASHGEVRSVSRVVEEARHLLPLLAPELPLERILDGIREALDEHLRDTFRTEGGASFDAARQPAREPVPCKLELNELIRRLHEVLPSKAEPPPAGTPDTAEQLSILLYMLEEDRRPGVVDGIKTRLYSRLSRALDEEEIAAMGGWAESLCLGGRPAQLADRLLPMLFEQLRRAAPASTIAVLLRALQTPRPPVVRTLWPHLAVELLFGLEGATEATREQAVGRMEEVSAEVLRAETPRFAALLPAGHGRFSSRYLSTPRRRLRSFHELILGLPDAQELAGQIVTAYRNAPPPNSPARALVAIRSDEHAQRYLQRVLREDLDGGESQALRRMGAGIVAAALHALTRSERRAPWVPEAIRALDSLRTPYSLEVVERILRSRRWLILWEWPAACRRAAFAVRAFFRLEQVATSARAAQGPTR